MGSEERSGKIERRIDDIERRIAKLESRVGQLDLANEKTGNRLDSLEDQRD
jgi:hypothetical protein